MRIQLVLLVIIENYHFLKNKCKYSTIFTDSMLVINNLKINKVSDLTYYYNKINLIYKLLNKLKNDFIFQIIKIKSHANYKENDKVDLRAI